MSALVGLRPGDKVLVTGGMGFLGSHLVPVLLERGCAVVVVDDLSSGTRANAVPWLEHVECVACDAAAEEMFGLIGRGDFRMLFHLAGNAYVPPSIDNPTNDLHRTFLSTFNLLEAVRTRSPGSQFVYASSAAVYGNPDQMPIEESRPSAPISPYGAAKVASESYVRVFATTYGLKATCLRFFSMYGPRQRKQVVFDIIRRLHENPIALELFGTGDELRDFSYVEDSVAAAVLVADAGAADGEPYNVASGRSVSIHQVADAIAEVMGLAPEIRFLGTVRPGDPLCWEADIAKLLSLGYAPKTDLYSGLTATVEWYREERPSMRVR